MMCFLDLKLVILNLVPQLSCLHFFRQTKSNVSKTKRHDLGATTPIVDFFVKIERFSIHKLRRGV